MGKNKKKIKALTKRVEALEANAGITPPAEEPAQTEQ